MNRTARSARPRPNRLLVALAAAWVILALAIGGAATADSSSAADQPPTLAGSSQD